MPLSGHLRPQMLHLSAQLPRSRGLANLNVASRWYSFFSRWWQIGRIHPPKKCQKKNIEKGWPTWPDITQKLWKSTFWFLRSCSLKLWGPFNVLLELPCSWTVMLEVLKSSLLQERFMCSLDLIGPGSGSSHFRSKGTSQHPASFMDPWPIQGSIYFYWILHVPRQTLPKVLEPTRTARPWPEGKINGTTRWRMSLISTQPPNAYEGQQLWEDFTTMTSPDIPTRHPNS